MRFELVAWLIPTALAAFAGIGVIVMGVVVIILPEYERWALERQIAKRRRLHLN